MLLDGNDRSRSIKGFPWVYHGNSQRCYLSGTRGPCPAGHFLFGDKIDGITFGNCECTCGAPVLKLQLPNTSIEMGINPDAGPIVMENAQFRFCHFKKLTGVNEAVVLKENGSCYFLETQVD